MSPTPATEYHFVYQGIEYDATEFSSRHPGGLRFFDTMKAVDKDIT
jgi:cytochrome b involved in lipid metabolism